MLGRLRTLLALIRLAALLASIATSGMALDPQSATRDYIRTDFTVENGLPSNVINAIVQTRNGFLWVGTDAGLVRFNGRRFIAIELRPPHRAQGSVRALVEGPDGALWVGTGAGLARIPRPALDVYDQNSTEFFHPTGSSDEITCLRFAPDGSLWVGTEGGLYRFENRRFESVLSGVIINRLEKAADGHLLVITKQGLIEWDGARLAKDGALTGQLNVGADQIFDVFEDRHGARWFCTIAGLATARARQHRTNPDSIRILSVLRDRNTIALRAEHAYQDDQGTMWVQFAGSLYRVSGTVPEPLAQSSVREIYGDQDGDLWAGTNGEGLLRFTDRSVRMFTTRDGLPSNIPMAVLSRHDGSLWVGTNCGGLSVYANHRFHAYSEKDGLLNSCVWSLAEDSKDNLWLGTWGGGLFRFANNHFTRFGETRGFGRRHCTRYSSRERWFIVDCHRWRSQSHGERTPP